MEFLFFLFFFYLPTISFQVSCPVSPPPATYQDSWRVLEVQAFALSPFLCFASSSLMFGQPVNCGWPVSSLCWPHRERGRGEPDLLRETMMMGAAVQVLTSSEWRLPPVFLWNIKSNIFCYSTFDSFFFPKGNTILHGERIVLLAWLWLYSFQSNNLGVTVYGTCASALWVHRTSFPIGAPQICPACAPLRWQEMGPHQYSLFMPLRLS